MPQSASRRRHYLLRRLLAQTLVAAAVTSSGLALGATPSLAATTSVAWSRASASTGQSFIGTPLAEQYDITASDTYGLATGSTGQPGVVRVGGGGGGSAGNTHCFASLSGGPHIGCQFNHTDSIAVIEDARNGEYSLLTAVFCQLAGRVSDLCTAIGQLAVDDIASVRGVAGNPNACLEAGLWWYGSWYAKDIPCSIE